MFTNARIFEEQLLQVTRDALQGKGQLLGNQALSALGRAGPIADLIFLPNGEALGSLTIFEFKFSRTTTLPHSIVLGALQQFGTIREANVEQRPRFVLVTNGRVRDANEVPEDVVIVDSVRNRNIWKSKLVELLEEAPARIAGH